MRKALLSICAALGLLGGLLAGQAAASSRTPALSQATSNATVTIALPASTVPNYIAPFTSVAGYYAQNMGWFEELMWPPLYWYGTSGNATVLDKQLSLAGTPVYEDNDTVVKITLKSRMWSNGKPVTARDVQFWINLIKAGKDNYAEYTAGQFPDNITKSVVVNAHTLVLHLNRSYNPTWFSDAELPLLTPVPQQAWDRESANGPIGNYDLTPSGAALVYKFLNKESTDLGTWATDPLWKVVDGAWILSSYSPSTGRTALVPNRKYDGASPARIGKLVELPFTSDGAELAALRSGLVDYGYLPLEDTKQAGLLKASGYKIEPWPGYGISFIHVNFSNPTTGPMLKQLYVRQAIELSIDQPLLIRSVFHGYAAPTYGVTPVKPASAYLTGTEKSDPYPYDPARAKRLLESHGWRVVNGGKSTCIEPTKCGSGIKKGASLSLTNYYFSGDVQNEEVAEQMQSTLETLGISMTIRSLPLGSYYDTVAPCTKGSTCTWSLGLDSYYYYPFAFPSPPTLFEPTSPGDTGYNSPIMNRLLIEYTTSKSLAAYHAYESYAALQLPVLYYPVEVTQVSVIKDDLHGTTPQNPLLSIEPQLWSVGK